MGICCGDLLNDPALKGIRLVAGESGLGRMVDWIYFGDVIDDLENGVQWVNGNELVMITGVSVKGDWTRLLRTFPAYHRWGIAGILISFGRYFSDVPDDVIQEANRLSLPVFTLPWEVKLVDASRSICNAIISSEISEHESANILTALLFGSLASSEHLSLILSKANYSLNHSYRVGLINMMNTESYVESDGQHILKPICTNFLRLAHRVFDGFSPKVFLSLKDNTLIFLIASETQSKVSSAVERVCLSMQQLYPRLQFKSGVGKTYRHPEKLPESYRQAKQALAETLIDNGIASPAFYSESDIYSLLFSIKDQELLKAYHEKTLASLYEYEKNNNLDLVGTLECYYNHELRIPEAAEALCIHKNTLKYRLSKIQEILSVNLKDPSTITAIQLAIRISRLLKADIQADLLERITTINTG